MTFIDLEEIPEQEPVPGFRVRFVHSDSMTLAHWRISEGAALPEHTHPHEQVVNMIDGQFELTVDGEPKILSAGYAVVIPPNVPHGGRAITDCRIIDAFHPVREDYR